ncbi:MAG TPA: hypothetical protein VK158_03030 [Acidobacteriota bacterium]|nr:hypothetical protein [Acidobacteriota bacterium]
MNKDVYILEDHRMMSEIVAKAVRDAGFTAHVFGYRNGFLKALHTSLPYAAILDNVTPKFENGEPEIDMGYHCMREIQEFHPTVRFAFHTSSKTKLLEGLTDVRFFSSKPAPLKEIADFLQ